MGHRKKNTPHRGSLGYRRNKAKRHTARIRTWPESLEPKLLGFAGYKAGMTHIAMINTDTRSPFYKQEQFIPVTIIETPPMTVFSIRTYKIESLLNNLAVDAEIWTEKAEKDLSRRIKIPKEKSNIKQQIALAKAKMDDVTEVRVLAHTKPREAGLPQKSPDIIEIKVGGKPEKAFEYATSILGKEVTLDEVYSSGDFIDVNATTKGKGFAGPVKRHGVKIMPRKKRKGRRVVGCIGPWHPARVMWTVPRAGQLGYFSRTEFNKQILKIGEDGEEVTPINGFKRYGKVNKYCMVRGSVPGSTKRLIRFRNPLRPKHVEFEDLQITYISTLAKN